MARRISSTIWHWLRGVLLPERSQYNATLLDPSDTQTARIHYSYIVKILRSRASKLRCHNRYILAIIVIIIIACLVLFWLSDAIAKNYVGEELQKIIKRRDDKLTTISKLKEQLPSVERELILLEQVRNGTKPLVDLIESINQLPTNWESDHKGLRDAIRLGLSKTHFSEARKIFMAIDNNSQTVFLDYVVKITLNSKMLDRIRQACAENGIFPKDISMKIDHLREAYISIGNSFGEKDRVVEQRDLNEIKNMVAVIASFKGSTKDGIANIQKWLSSKEEDIKNQRITIGSEDIQSQLDIHEKELRELEEEKTKLQQEQSSITSLAWIPSFTVRAGSVILALFLVQYFMSIYKYNITAATFYDSRADVLQLSTTDDAKTRINIDDVVKMSPFMHDEKNEFKIPDSTIDKFADAVKQRIG